MVHTINYKPVWFQNWLGIPVLPRYPSCSSGFDEAPGATNMIKQLSVSNSMPDGLTDARRMDRHEGWNSNVDFTWLSFVSFSFMLILYLEPCIDVMKCWSVMDECTEIWRDRRESWNNIYILSCDITLSPKVLIFNFHFTIILDYHLLNFERSKSTSLFQPSCLSVLV